MFAFNPFNEITDLIQLQENKNLIPSTNEDKEAIESALNNDIPIMFDNLNKVWTEGGQYIADLKEWK